MKKMESCRLLPVLSALLPLAALADVPIKGGGSRYQPPVETGPGIIDVLGSVRLGAIVISLGIISFLVLRSIRGKKSKMAGNDKDKI